ncbi:MAG: Asp23/Gls24 family envelope stress response protein [Clostridia bacterium]|nr:Asp23/Gls24 family envelope stress response protein [Clostridia bacterium]
MARFKKMLREKNEGKIVFGDAIVHNIVTLAVSELPYVELYHKSNSENTNAAVTVFFDKKGIDVDICVKVHFSQRVSETVFRIQEAVRHSVESMTEYHIQSVNVLVLGVIFEDMEDKHEEKLDQDDSFEETDDKI